MIKAVLALLTAFHIVEATSQTYELLAMVADSTFYQYSLHFQVQKDLDVIHLLQQF